MSIAWKNVQKYCIKVHTYFKSDYIRFKCYILFFIFKITINYIWPLLPLLYMTVLPFWLLQCTKMENFVVSIFVCTFKKILNTFLKSAQYCKVYKNENLVHIKIKCAFFGTKVQTTAALSKPETMVRKMLFYL